MLTESDIIKIIAKRFPEYIQAMLINIPINNFIEVAYLLGKEDTYNNHNNNDQV